MSPSTWQSEEKRHEMRSKDYFQFKKREEWQTFTAIKEKEKRMYCNISILHSLQSFRQSKWPCSTEQGDWEGRFWSTAFSTRSRILNYSGSSLIFSVVMVWDCHYAKATCSSALQGGLSKLIKIKLRQDSVEEVSVLVRRVCTWGKSLISSSSS